MSYQTTFQNNSPLAVNVFVLEGRHDEHHVLTVRPFHTETVENEAGQHWLVRDAYSEVELARMTSKEEQETFELRSDRWKPVQWTGQVNVTFVNASIFHLVATIVTPEGEHALSGELIPPGTEFHQEVPAHSFLRFREAQSGSEIDFFIPGTEGHQHKQVILRSLDGDNPTDLTVYNNSHLHLHIEWLDYEGKRTDRNQIEIEPFGVFLQRTYNSHPWVLSDMKSGRILNFFTAFKPVQFYFASPENLATLHPELVPETEEVLLTFENTTSLAVDLYWIQPDGTEKHYGILRPGDKKRMRTYTGHSWRIRSLNSQKEVGLYIPGREPEQYYKIDLKSHNSEYPSTFKFTNDSPLNLSLEWLDFNGKPHQRATLKPGESVDHSTYLSHPFLVRDIHSGVVVDFLQPEPGHKEVGFDGRTLRSLPGVKSTKVRFINAAMEKVDLYRVDQEGEAHRHVTLDPGVIYDQGTYATHPWRIMRHGTQEEIDLFIPGGQARQEYQIAATSYKDKPLINVEFYNITGFPLKAYWRNDEGEEFYCRQIVPHDHLKRKSYKGCKWIFKDVVHDQEVASLIVTHEQRHVISSKSLRSTPNAASAEKNINVSLHNRTPFHLDLYYIDDKGQEIKEPTSLRPDHNAEIKSYPSQVWEARDRFSGKVIDNFLVGGSDLTVDLKIRSWKSEQKSRMHFKNDTSLVAEVFWVNFEGTEEHKATLMPGGEVLCETYLTHPWIIRDKNSHQVIERVFGDKPLQEVTIKNTDLVTLYKDNPVKLKIINNLGFTVDVYKVDELQKETLVGHIHPLDDHVFDSFHTQPWRIRDHQSQGEVEMYIADERENQELDLRFKSQEGDRKIHSTIRFYNMSPLEQVDLYCYDKDGNETLVDAITVREAKTLETYMTQPWVARERSSHRVVGYTVATKAHKDFQITGDHLCSIYGGKLKQITFKNETVFRVDLNWVNYKGEEKHYKTIEPGETIRQGTYPSHPWRIREHVSQAQFDLFLPKDAGDETHVISNSILRKGARKSGTFLEEGGALEKGGLWKGEVALYPEVNFGGTPWIVHDDLPDFVKESGMNDIIKSIRLGPGTALTIFKHIHFEGENDVFYMDIPNLADTDVGNDHMSSIKITKIASEDTSGISAVSRLTQDIEIVPDPDAPANAAVKTKEKRISVYRSSITFPATVSEVDIKATEEVAISIGSKIKDEVIDAAKPLRRVKVPKTKKLVIQTPSDQLSKAALMIRTNTMGEDEWFFVFPDADLHTKLAGLDEGAMWARKDDLGIGDQYKENDINQVQKAIQNLTNTIPSVHNKGAQGQTKDLKVVPNGMEYDAWELDMGGEGHRGDAKFKPLSPAQVAAMEANARSIDNELASWGFSSIASGITKIATKTVEVAGSAVDSAVEFGGKAVKDTAQTVKEVGEKVVNEAVEAGETLAEAGEAVWDTTVDVASEAAEAIEEVGEFIEDTAEALAEIPSKVIDFAEEVVEEAIELGKKVIQAVIEVGGEVLTFVIDTAEKVAKFVEKIVKEIGATIAGIVQWLEDLFSWGDILKTHDKIVEMFNFNISKVPGILDTAKNQLLSLLTSVKSDVIRTLDDYIDKMGVSEPAERAGQRDEDHGEAFDKINWFMDKIFGGDEEEEEKGGGDKDLAGSVQGLFDAFLDNLRKVVEENGDAIINAFVDGFEYIIAAIKKGTKIIEHVISALLSIIKGLALLAFSVIELVVGALFDLFKALIELIKTVVNEKLDIPFISALYKTITRGRDLTFLSLLSLLVAAPATILSKLILGHPPLEETPSLAQGFSKGGMAGFLLIYAVVHFVMIPFEVIGDGGASGSLLIIAPIVLGCMAQFMGMPIITRKTEEGGFDKGEFDLGEGLKADKSSSMFWSHMVWTYQWLYVGLAAIGLKSLTNKPLKTGDESAVAFFNTLTGVFHLLIMIKLSFASAVELDEDGTTAEEVGLSVVRTASWVSDSVPPLGKVCSVDSVKAAFAGKPVIINQGFNVVGHTVEGVMYLIRAGIKDV